MIGIGADADYIKSGLSYFTVETKVNYLEECVAGDNFHVDSQIILADGKKLKLAHKMCAEDGSVISTCEQFLLHVDLKTRKSCPPRADVETNMMRMADAHGKLENLLEA